jgi:hypothetical protein
MLHRALAYDELRRMRALVGAHLVYSKILFYAGLEASPVRYDHDVPQWRRLVLILTPTDLNQCVGLLV